jgi:hypothetical protein
VIRDEVIEDDRCVVEMNEEGYENRDERMIGWSKRV